MQETQIKVSIDDNEALQRLREMADLIERMQDGLGDLNMPPMGGGGAGGGGGGGGGDGGGGAGGGGAGGGGGGAGGGGGLAGLGIVQSLSGNFTAGQMTQTLATDLMNYAKTLPVGGNFIAPISILLKRYGKSLEERQQLAGEVANLEQLEAQIAGVMDSSQLRADVGLAAEQLSDLGYDPQQSRQLFAKVASQVGFKSGAGDFTSMRDIAAAERLGISSDSIAQLGRVITQNTGTSVGKALDASLNLSKIAEGELDLRGSGVSSFLNSMGSFVDGLTQRGITSVTGMEALSISRIARTTGQKGMRPMQIMQGLQGTASGALGQLAAPFQGLAESALLADVFGRSSSYFDAMEKMETLVARPDDVADIVNKQFGSMSKNVLAAIPNIGTRDAAKLAGGLVSGTMTGEGTRMSAAALAEQMLVSGEIATQQLSAVEAARNDELMVKLIQLSGEMRTSLIQSSENEKVMTDLGSLLSEVTKALDKNTSKMLEGFSKFLELF